MSISICVPKHIIPVSKKNRFFGWLGSIAGMRTAAFLIALGVSIPILVILLSFVRPEPKIWEHIIETLLVELVKNTLMLCIGVLAGTFLLGVSLAWLTAVFEFPGRNVFNWALMLPLAMPTYVLAFVFIGLLDFSGPVQTILRSYLPGKMGWFPGIRSPGGVIMVMTLALYPYVYLLARNAFQTQGKSVLEVSQAFGYSRGRAFFKAALPMARPWIAGGLILVLMETLADFGAVSIFNFDTFTTGIYKAWFGFFSLSAAAQLSCVLLAVVFVLVLIEQQMRARMRFGQVGRMNMETGRIRLTGWKKWWAFGYASVVLSTAFAVPAIQLLVWALKSFSVEFNTGYIGLLIRSQLLSLWAAGVITGLGLLLAYTQRQNSEAVATWTIRISTIGYALPGTVLAVGVVIWVGFIDRQINGAAAYVFGIKPGPIFNGTVLTVIFAYTVRFLTIGFNSINSAMLRVTKSLDEASQMLGVSGVKLLGKVHLPVLKNGLYTAAIIVFVEVMKEMPITLMTRPFGWDTLAVKIFELTSEGEWQRAALPSIVLVLAGLIPLMLLNKRSERSK